MLSDGNGARHNLIVPNDATEYLTIKGKSFSKNISIEDQDEPIPKLLKIEEAADSLRCDERTIRYYLFEAKSLPYLKLGKEARMRESDLSGFIENLLEGQSSSNKELL